jgi:transglutaminase-like putative cysteine protease
MTYVLDDAHYPADVVWDNATGSCSEYSYVFTALARIDGFSTRFSGNTIFSPSKAVTNSDGSMNYTDEVYHRFVKLYFPETGWTPIDANREDSASGAPFTTRLFLGYDQNVLTFSKTFFDDNYLGDGYTSAYSYSRGSNVYQAGMVTVAKLGCWTVSGNS